jgi:L-ascorbate metabolism protein UlaG (beta-lactamase superfamily)
MRLDYHGHATFSLYTDGGTRLLFDPYFGNNPKFEGTYEDVGGVDFVLASHGHFDHFEDAIPVLKKTGATLIGTVEIVSFAKTQGVDKIHGMNIGGAHDFPFGRVKLTPALHGGQVEGDESGRFTTAPCGFLLHIDGRRIYYSGDTALITDMQLLRGKVDVAILPIGDNFTMGPDDAAMAVDFIRPKHVIPVHYNTWPLIAQDPTAFAAKVGKTAEVVVVEPGGSWSF